GPWGRLPVLPREDGSPSPGPAPGGAGPSAAGESLRAVKDGAALLNGARPSRVPRVRDTLPPDARRLPVPSRVSPAGAASRPCQAARLRAQVADALTGKSGGEERRKLSVRIRVTPTNGLDQGGFLNLEASDARLRKGSSRLAALAVVVALAVVFAGLALSSGGARLAYADGDATAQAQCQPDPFNNDENANVVGPDGYAQAQTTEDGFPTGTDTSGSIFEDPQAWGTANCNNGGTASGTAHVEGDWNDPAFAAATGDATDYSTASAQADAQTDSVGPDATCDAGGYCSANASADATTSGAGSNAVVLSNAFASHELGGDQNAIANADATGDATGGADVKSTASATQTGNGTSNALSQALGSGSGAYVTSNAVSDNNQNANAFAQGTSGVIGGNSQAVVKADAYDSNATALGSATTQNYLEPCDGYCAGNAS